MDPNTILHGEGGPTGLFLAVRENRPDVVAALLKAGAKVINQGSNALVAAAETGNVAMLNRLLETPVAREDLDEAFALGLTRPVLEVLLARGADLKARGAEALLYTRDPEARSFLISRGADINFRDATGKTWLERSDFGSINLDTLQTLIELGADLDSRDRNGWTLLTTYASKGYLNGLQMLVAKNVTVDLPNQDGRTALSLVCDLRRDGRDIAQLLLKSGADVNTRDAAGKRPIDYAREHANDSLVEWLVAHGAAA
jgi:ankyrin repeat protein